MEGEDHGLVTLEMCYRKGLLGSPQKGENTVIATGGPENMGLWLRIPLLPPHAVTGQVAGDKGELSQKWWRRQGWASLPHVLIPVAATVQANLPFDL